MCLTGSDGRFWQTKCEETVSIKYVIEFRQFLKSFGNIESLPMRLNLGFEAHSSTSLKGTNLLPRAQD